MAAESDTPENLPSELAAIQRFLSNGLRSQAHRSLMRFLTEAPQAVLKEHVDTCRECINGCSADDQKRSESILEARLAGNPVQPAPQVEVKKPTIPVSHVPHPPVVPRSIPVPVTSVNLDKNVSLYAPRSNIVYDNAALQRRCRDSLKELSAQHIFQWTTYYPEAVDAIFQDHETIDLKSDNGKKALSTLFEEFNIHAHEIYVKGFDHIRKTRNRPDDAIAKSISGLQQFLGIPARRYAQLAFNRSNAAQARILRAITSMMIAGIICGYGSLELDRQHGWQLLARYPRSWLNYLAFVNEDGLRSIMERMEAADFREGRDWVSGLRTCLLPLTVAFDKIVGEQNDSNYTMPRLGSVEWTSGRYLEISFAWSTTLDWKRLLAVRCHLDRTILHRAHLQGSISQKISLTIAPLLPDLREMVDQNEILRSSVIDTAELASSPASRPAFDQTVSSIENILRAALQGYLSQFPESEPITYNFASNFPAERPGLYQDPVDRGLYVVQRRNVRNLIQSFERDTGIRLWCSVRRSGKTIASLDLGSPNPTTIVVNQTMEFIGQISHEPQREENQTARIFYDKFIAAITKGTQISGNFFQDIISDCIRGHRANYSRVIFVLDEYESLFSRMHDEVMNNRLVRHTVVQPLMNQMVAFSQTNLIIFLGQEPTAHYILMEQNQLSPLVRQDPFPLFEHVPGSLTSEFADLVRRIMTDRVTFDAGFVDAIYQESAGHAYLTAKVLDDFCEWLIATRRRANELFFSRGDFERFTVEQLSTASMGTFKKQYETMQKYIHHMISERMRRESPWVYTVVNSIQRIAQAYPDTLSCPREKFEELARDLVRPLNFDPNEIISTASRANFLTVQDGYVRPKIPLMARIAMYTKPAV